MSVSEQELLAQLHVTKGENPSLGWKQLLEKVCEQKSWVVGHKRSRVILKKFKDSLSGENSPETPSLTPMASSEETEKKTIIEPLNPRQARVEEITRLIKAVKQDNPDFGVQRITRACGFAGFADVKDSFVKNVMKELGLLGKVDPPKKRAIIEPLQKSQRPQKSQKRARDTDTHSTLPESHVAGNWASIVYIPISQSPALTELLSECTPLVVHDYPLLQWSFVAQQGEGEEEPLKQRGDGSEVAVPPGLHLSLSRTFFLRTFQISAFMDHLKLTFSGLHSTLEQKLASCSSSSSPSSCSPSSAPSSCSSPPAPSSCSSSPSFGGPVCLRFAREVLYFANDTKTTLFACLRVLPSERLHALLGRVNLSMKEFQLRSYYDNPVFHVSFASAPLPAESPPPLPSRLLGEGLGEEQAAAQVECKIGNKLFRVNLGDGPGGPTHSEAALEGKGLTCSGGKEISGGERDASQVSSGENLTRVEGFL